jgi:hypothetical protein
MFAGNGAWLAGAPKCLPDFSPRQALSQIAGAQSRVGANHARGRDRWHRERRHERRRGARRRRARGIDPGPRPARPRMAAGEDGVGARRHHRRRPPRPPRGGRRRGPPRLGDPAVPRRGGAPPNQRHRLRARLRRGRGGRRSRAGLRLIDRRVLAGPEGSRGRRVVAHRRHRVQLLLAPQGGGRVDARPLRGGEPDDPCRPPAARPDHEVGGCAGDSPALRRPLSAALRDPPRADPRHPEDPEPPRPGRPLARHRRGLSARHCRGRPRRLQRRGGTDDRARVARGASRR